MRIENQFKLLALIAIILVGIPLADNFANVRDSFFSSSDPASTAHFYFCVIVGIGTLIVQNFFIRRAIHDLEQPANVRWEREVLKQ